MELQELLLLVLAVGGVLTGNVAFGFVMGFVLLWALFIRHLENH